MKIDTPVRHIKATGANYSAKAKIKNLMEEGYTVTEVSDMVLVEEKCVANFFKHYGGPPKLVKEEKPVEKKVSKKKVSKKKVLKKKGK